MLLQPPCDWEWACWAPLGSLPPPCPSRGPCSALMARWHLGMMHRAGECGSGSGTSQPAAFPISHPGLKNSKNRMMTGEGPRLKLLISSYFKWLLGNVATLSPVFCLFHEELHKYLLSLWRRWAVTGRKRILPRALSQHPVVAKLGCHRTITTL